MRKFENTMCIKVYHITQRGIGLAASIKKIKSKVFYFVLFLLCFICYFYNFKCKKNCFGYFFKSQKYLNEAKTLQFFWVMGQFVFLTNVFKPFLHIQIEATFGGGCFHIIHFRTNRGS